MEPQARHMKPLMGQPLEDTTPLPKDRDCKQALEKKGGANTKVRYPSTPKIAHAVKGISGFNILLKINDA